MDRHLLLSLREIPGDGTSKSKSILSLDTGNHELDTSAGFRAFS